MSKAFSNEDKSIDTEDKILKDHTNMWYSLIMRRKEQKPSNNIYQDLATGIDAH